MPDITMCANGKKCRKRKTCYRFAAKPNRRQSYSDFYEKGKRCGYYWPIKEER